MTYDEMRMRERLVKQLSSEFMLDELRRRGIGVLSDQLAEKAIAFVLDTGRRMEAGDYGMTEDREWADEAMRAYLKAVEIYE